VCACVTSLLTQKKSGIRALVVMADSHCRGPNVESTPARERDLCDVKVAELRRQVQ
jgi:hypothetical protein